MTTAKAIEDLTLDEIKEQLAIYQRFYYHKKSKRNNTGKQKRKALNNSLKDKN